MKDSPTTWPIGSRLAGSPLLNSERQAWRMGYAAGLAEAVAIQTPLDPALDVDLEASGMGRTVKGSR